MPDTFDFYVDGAHGGAVIGLQIHEAGRIVDVPMSVETARIVGTVLLSHVAAINAGG